MQNCQVTKIISPDPVPQRRRLIALDGLRGVAALVVVFHHCFLTSPKLDIALNNSMGNSIGSVSWLAVNTPIHLFWEGTQAVYVFFVLSGFVLVLPVVNRWRDGRSFDWRGYYPQRFLRLYLPVWVALLLALANIAVFGRHVVPGGSYWLNEHFTNPHGVTTALHQATLLVNFEWVNSVLWSLKCEVLFSVALPLYVITVWRFRRWGAPKLLVVAAMLYVGFDKGHDLLIYPPMFWIGSFLAVEHERLSASVTRWTARRWLPVTVVALLGLNSYWLILGLRFVPPPPAIAVTEVLVVAGAALLVFVAAHWRSTALERAPAQWLGKRSFSLYLVHEPIVVALALALGGRHLAVLVLLAVPISLVVAEVFGRVVEAPSHRLAQRVGRWASAQPASREAVTVRVGAVGLDS